MIELISLSICRKAYSGKERLDNFSPRVKNLNTHI